MLISHTRVPPQISSVNDSNTVYPRLSEPRVSESSHIRNSQNQDYNIIHIHLMIFICNRTLCNIFTRARKRAG